VRSAYPAVRSQEELWDTFMAPTLGASRCPGASSWRPGCGQRHPALTEQGGHLELLDRERMARYVDEPVPLGREAVEGASTPPA